MLMYYSMFVLQQETQHIAEIIWMCLTILWDWCLKGWSDNQIDLLFCTPYRVTADTYHLVADIQYKICVDDIRQWVVSRDHHVRTNNFGFDILNCLVVVVQGFIWTTIKIMIPRYLKKNCLLTFLKKQPPEVFYKKK